MSAPKSAKPAAGPHSGFRDRALGWIRLPHTFPVLAVTGTTFLLALASGGSEAGTSRALLLAVTMFFGQVSIGIHNDVLDRERDAVAKPAKPIPAGTVSPRAALVVAGLSATVFAVLHIWLGADELVIGAAAISAGYTYNAWLKHTPFGPLAYVAGFGLLALWVWVATDALSPAIAWTFVLGVPLLVGLGVANALPDIEGDRRTGVPTLASTLGGQTAVVLVWTLAGVGTVLMLMGWAFFEPRPALLVAGFGLATLLWVSGVLASLHRAHWTAFRIYGALTASVVIGWLAAVR